MKRSAKKKTASSDEPAARLYTLDVLIIGGLMTDQFVERNPEVSRTIQVRGDQTLLDLHFAIFDAFGRFDEHMYEFQFGKQPHDRNAHRYVLPTDFEDDYGDAADDLTETAIDSLGLKARQKFWYWFDFGDDWWHEIKVLAIDDKTPRGKFPRVTKRVGRNPPQYPDW